MNRQKLKQNARATIMTSRRPHLLLVSFLYILVSMLLMQIFLNLSGVEQFLLDLERQSMAALEEFYQQGVLAPLVLPAIEITPIGLTFFVLPWIFYWIMELGYLFYARETVRGETLGYQSLLEGFNYFFKGISIRLIRLALVAAGLMLFVVPGVIIRIAFSQVEFLLLDNPDKSVFWIFRASWLLMRRRMLEYLALRLSFAGWIFLGLVIMSMIPLLYSAVQLGIRPYVTLTRVNYYQAITGRAPPEEADWQKPGL